MCQKQILMQPQKCTGAHSSMKAVTICKQIQIGTQTADTNTDTNTNTNTEMNRGEGAN